MRFGKVELYILSDGLAWQDGGAVFGLVPRVLWEKVIAPDELNRIPAPLDCLLLVSEGKRILVDTGYGDKLSSRERENVGLIRHGGLLGDLARLGFRREDVDIVINTHLHLDHCGGNTVQVGDKFYPTFPRAEYWVQRLELADASFPNERTQATYRAESFEPLREHAQLRVISGDTRVTGEVRCLVTPGHTRAHQSVLIESAGKKAIFLGDLASRPINLERLVWIPAFDVDPLQTLETKRRLRDWALEEQILLIFDHEMERKLGYLRREGEGYQVEPVLR